MRTIPSILALTALAFSVAQTCAAQTGETEQVLQQNSSQQKYTFLLFYREDNPATRNMAQSLKAGLAQHGDQAGICYVNVTNPAEQHVVKKFGVSRAPLPFTLAVAPNGAVTALMSQKVTPAQLATAFVTPGMADCMKAMQQRKLVLVCVHSSSQGTLPTAAGQFQSDPDFQNRLELISVHSADPQEAAFLKQMEIEPSTHRGSTMVFMAPPAVLVGKFASNATKAEMTAALHAAGKCCDDPNCKHGHGPQATKAPSSKRK